MPEASRLAKERIIVHSVISQRKEIEEMEENKININRKGSTEEYKRGHYYFTFTEWEDGHCEIELHRCMPELLFHSCDKEDLEKVKTLFLKLVELEQNLGIVPLEIKNINSIEKLINNEQKIIEYKDYFLNKD